MTILAFLAAAKTRQMAALHALLLAATCCAPALATAASVTYSYKGNDYTQFIGGACLTSSMATSLTFTVKAPLSANFSGKLTPLAWAANDGRTKFSSKSANTSASLTVGTDANGNISSWYIVAGAGTGGQASYVVSLHERGVGTYDQAQIQCGKSTASAESNRAGTWSF